MFHVPAHKNVAAAPGQTSLFSVEVTGAVSGAHFTVQIQARSSHEAFACAARNGWSVRSVGAVRQPS